MTAPISSPPASSWSRGTARKSPALPPGAVVGEIALLHAVARTATVRAAGPARVLAIDGDEFLAAATGGATARDAVDELVTSRLAEVTVR